MTGVAAERVMNVGVFRLAPNPAEVDKGLFDSAEKPGKGRPGAKQPSPAADHGNFGIVVQPGGLFFEPPGGGQVIMIHNRQIFARGQLHKPVSGFGYAQIGVAAEATDAGIGKTVDDFRRSVGRGVVKQQQLKIGKSLI